MELRVSVPGSCGELIQGYTPQGQPFLLTCPIDRYATAVIRDDGRRQVRLGAKAAAGLRAVLRLLGCSSYPYSITVTSSLPQGKGMASSTADVSAVLIGAAYSLGTTLTSQDIAVLAASIEPTDGVFCPGLCCLNYQTGAIYRTYAAVPDVQLAVVDTGGSIDTVAFHARRPPVAYSRRAWSLLQPTWSPLTLAQAATQSAIENQRILYKPAVTMLVKNLAKSDALGLTVAHSGTVVGLIFPVGARRIRQQVQTLLAGIPGVRHIDTVSLISGGYTIWEG